MVELTPEQHALLFETGGPVGSPARIHDPSDKREYVLIPASVFARLESLVSVAEDEDVQAAWLSLSRQKAAAWVAENPF